MRSNDSPAAPESPLHAGAAEHSDGVARRTFLQLLGTAALAGAAACTRPPAEKILPYTRQPVDLTPGVPQHYATSFTQGGFATGLLVTSWEGRPTHISGNPDHPISRGACGVFEQASLLQLYDPHRAKTFSFRGAPNTWKGFLQAVKAREAGWEKNGGRGLAFLLEPNASPLRTHLRHLIAQRFPEASFDVYDPVGANEEASGAQLAFGEAFRTHHDLTHADVVLSLGEDFLGAGPAQLKDAREFSRRRVPGPRMNRLYIAEDRLSITGMNADHRLPLKPSAFAAFTLAVAAELARDVRFRVLAPLATLAGSGLSEAQRGWAREVAADLARSAGRCLVLAGHDQPAAIHGMALALNAALGNFGETVSALPVAGDAQGRGPRGLKDLAERIRAGAVDTLVVTAFNPVYSAPVDLEWAAVLSKVPMSVYHGLYEDETAEKSTWFLPATHSLECWSDAQSVDGTTSAVQPLVTPLFNSTSEVELLGAFVPALSDLKPYQVLKAYWKNQLGETDFENRWEQALGHGVFPTPLPSAFVPRPRLEALLTALQGLSPPRPGLELHFVRDEKVRDGRFANNAWLQELPDPVTKLTWGNAALLGPTTAAARNLRSGDRVRLELEGRALELPVLVAPGTVDGCVVLPLGYGRSGAELVARGVGVNAGVLRTTAQFTFASGVQLTPLGNRSALAVTQEHWSLAPSATEASSAHGTGAVSTNKTAARPIALQTTLDELQSASQELESLRGPVNKLYQAVPESKSPYQWGMAVDLSRCTGCSACVVACQSENNIPVVGKEGVLRSREMHWLRVDRYFEGPPENPSTVPQPMACVHCEKAPCEYPCPVNATVHSDEGLNEMVYNRCVGTRYCANNCPYKVRRFNYLQYNGDLSHTERMGKNPDVTVRARGVMEKCTYCVQRIERARIDSRLEGRTLRDGELKSACQQACSAEAIVFGNLADKSSKVSALHADARRYDVLHELGTQPRTAYLVRVKNPNPAMETDA
jgi:Fe-S-cluster-containing dehydrogenase component